MQSPELAQSSPAHPHLRKQGTATQLIVDGHPFLVIGGELHNSSASSIEYMRPIWSRLVALHFNTVLAPVYWELIEPAEGTYDFALVDGLIHEARRNNLRLVLLWFGSWKNGMSSYIPAWVKEDVQRFPRAHTQSEGSVEVLSPLSEESRNADARAFAALMRHIRQVDGADHTVIMVQVENEVGILGDSRDRSEAANRAFAAPVPDELLSHLGDNQQQLTPQLHARWGSTSFKSEGSWEEVFGKGPLTDEIFMAWHYARYVDHVTAAGKAEYNLPMFVNAWLNRAEEQSGAYPSGGPLAQVLDIWLAGGPHIDILTPDIYQPNFEEWCRGYTHRGNPLFIPEMMWNDVGARNVFYAIGQHDAIGTSPFAVDSIGLYAFADGKLVILDPPAPPQHAPLAKSYAALSQLAPLILAHQGLGELAGFLLDQEHPSVTRELGGYELEISLDEVFAYKAEIGYGLIIATSPETFIGAGSGFRVRFRQKEGAGKVGIATVDEGEFQSGRWAPGRRLNGDENDQGRTWRFHNQRISIERCVVYRYQ
jgi:beta-galactosidase GanA